MKYTLQQQIEYIKSQLNQLEYSDFSKLDYTDFLVKKERLEMYKAILNTLIKVNK
jgi:hypothetical protein